MRRPRRCTVVLLIAISRVDAFGRLFRRKPIAASCRDAHETCAEWAASGECEANPGFMLQSCLHSCTTCADDVIPRNRTLAEKRARVMDGACDDEAEDCEERAAAGACHNGSDAPLRCAHTCRACGFSKVVKEAFECEDTNTNCADWAASGECTRNLAFMASSCAASCDGACRRKRAKCARPNPLAAGAAVAGTIERTMLRILRDFPQYHPRAISRPGMVGLPLRPGSVAPWIITLSDFLSDEEADSFVDGCRSHFERSLAGDQLSPVRTSKQCWCADNECARSPLTQRVEARVRNLTSIPSLANFEPFQVLRYEPGQFYRVHHDQNSGWFTPQGVRLFTFFMYLSTPARGGGTRFADLNITVPATKGTAVLWPSVTSADPSVDEPNTNHEGLPPEVGVKFAANSWIHNHDYRTPAARDCILAHRNTHSPRQF